MSLNPYSISNRKSHLSPITFLPSTQNHYKNSIQNTSTRLLAHRSGHHKRHTALRSVQIKLSASTTERRPCACRTNTARAKIRASVPAVQTRHRLGAEREAATCVALAMVLNVVERIDCRRRLGCERGDERLADLGRDAVVGEKKGQGVSDEDVGVASHVRVA